jgi:hypothetical protein
MNGAVHDAGMKRLIILAAAVGGAALIALTVQRRSSEDEYPEAIPPFIVNVKLVGKDCRLKVEGGQEVTGERLLQLGRAAAGRRGIVVYRHDTPYRCIGGTVYTLQVAGLTDIQTAYWSGD